MCINNKNKCSIACLLIFLLFLIGNIGVFAAPISQFISNSDSDIFPADAGSTSRSLMSSNLKIVIDYSGANSAAELYIMSAEQIRQIPAKTGFSFYSVTIAALMTCVFVILTFFRGIHIPYDLCRISTFIHEKDGKK